MWPVGKDPRVMRRGADLVRARDSGHRGTAGAPKAPTVPQPATRRSPCLAHAPYQQSFNCGTSPQAAHRALRNRSRNRRRDESAQTRRNLQREPKARHIQSPATETPEGICGTGQYAHASTEEWGAQILPNFRSLHPACFADHDASPTRGEDAGAVVKVSPCR